MKTSERPKKGNSEMQHAYRRTYRGPIQAVIMDLAGTVIDFGSVAPVIAMQRLFQSRCLDISITETRMPMGSHKREHIQAILSLPRITDAWISLRGTAPNDKDVDRLYEKYTQIQTDTILAYCDLIPGALEVFAALRARGCKLASNTGYNAKIVQALLPTLAEQGYVPDSTICVDDVARGRPYPDMCLRNLLDLGVEYVQACIKVDDSRIGIAEGRNAGMWTVGVAVSGTEIGLSRQEWESLPQKEQIRLRRQAYDKLYSAGAHYVIDTLADIEPVVDEIDERLTEGDRP